MAAEAEPGEPGKEEACRARREQQWRLVIQGAAAAGTLVTAIIALINAVNGSGPT